MLPLRDLEPNSSDDEKNPTGYFFNASDVKRFSYENGEIQEGFTSKFRKYNQVLP